MYNIIAITLLVFLIILFLTRNYKRKDKFHQDVRSKYKPKRNTDYLDDVIKFADNTPLYDDNYNMEFIEAQFHNDYRDTLTAFNNIAPSQKQIFNINNLPLDFSVSKESEVRKLVKDFMNELNKNIKNEVPDYRNYNNGFDELMPDKQMKTGWDKQMQELGLPKSLYPDPAKKAIISLLKVDHVEKYETEDELKYVCYLFLKKINVEDILVIKISFVLDKRVMNEERTFFNEKPIETHVVLEEIFMLGYMTEQGVGRTNDFRDKFYNFGNLEKDGIMDDQEIMKQLNQKLMVRHMETQRFDNTLDDQFRQLKLQAPHLSNYNSFQVTQTIYDDLSRPRNYS